MATISTAKIVNARRVKYRGTVGSNVNNDRERNQFF